MQRQLIITLLIVGLVSAPGAAFAATGLPELGSTDPGERSAPENPAGSTIPESGASPETPPDAAPQGADVRTDSRTVDGDESSVIELDGDAGGVAGEGSVTVMGAVWDGTQTPDSISYRTQDPEGAWSSWEQFEVSDGAGPDAGTSESDGATVGTEPVVVAEGDVVEVKVKGPADAEVSVETVTTPTTGADEQIAQNSSFVKAWDAGMGLAPRSETTTAAADHAAAAIDGDVHGYTAATAALNAGLTYVSRAQWGANESLKKCRPDTTSANRAMVVHHTAGATSYTRAQVPGILRGILTYHTQSRGWCDMGYNMLVDRYGTIYEGRSGGLDRAVVGAHASGFNSGTFGVSVMGTYSSPAPGAVVNALGRVGAWQANKWGWDPTSRVTLTSGGGDTSRYPAGRKVTLPRIFGHRDTSHTSCPGNGLYGQLRQVRTKSLAGFTPPTNASAITKFYYANTAKTGAPTTEERCGLKNKGCFRKFQKDSIHWSSASGAHFTKAGGPIQRQWRDQSYERGRLGYPVDEEFALRYRIGGTAQNFTGGTVIHSSASEAWSLVGGIGGKWKSSGWERSSLKLPITNEKCGLVRGGCFQKFERGSIHWSSRTGAWITKGAIQRAWGTQKWERGRLGYPKGDEYAKGAEVRQNFEGGYILWSPKSGARIFYT